MLTSENIAMEQAGSQGVTAMGWGVQEHLLKSLRFWSWNTELAKGQYLVSGYTWVVHLIETKIGSLAEAEVFY